MAAALLSPELSATWHLGTQRRRVAALAALAVLASLLFAGLVLLLQFVSLAVLLTWVVLVAIAWRPLVGLVVLFTLVQLFEGGGLDPLMAPGAYLHGGLGARMGLAGIPLSPVELLLLLTFGVWLAKGIMRRRLDARGGTLAGPMLLFVGALVLGLAWGAATGGDLYIAFWESRYLFYTGMAFLLAANTIRTRAHVRLLSALTLLGTGLFAIEGTYRRLALINTGQLGEVKEFWYWHEDVAFLGAFTLLVLAQQVFGAPRWQRLLGLALLPFTLFTLLASERRAGYIALVAAFLVFSLVLLVTRRKAFFLLAVPVMLAGAIYLPLFWSDTGLLGQPARAVRSLVDPSARDAASNLYRDLEKINIRATIQSSPLMGVGFGRPYLLMVQMPDISFFPFWQYITHANVLWVWLKTGAIGFVLFWILLGSAIARAAHAVRFMPSPDVRSFAAMAMSGIVCILVFASVDIGFTSGRITIFLGTLLGALSVLDRIQGPTRLNAALPGHSLPA